MSARRRYHPGTCEATDWGKRYGKNLEPQNFFGGKHQWHLAKDKNWGPWSCCGGAANSPGCKVQNAPSAAVSHAASAAAISAPVAAADPSMQGMKRIKFLEAGNICQVVADEGHCWRLDNGRIAKKKTEGAVWIWVEEDAVSEE